ncbi:MAG: hypothetical protein ACLU0O_00915 [Collinsella sp.]
MTIPSDRAVSSSPAPPISPLSMMAVPRSCSRTRLPSAAKVWLEYTPVMVDGKPYVVPGETFRRIHYKQPIFDGVEA